jgi:hypothetical protein
MAMRKYIIGAMLAVSLTIAGSAWAWDDMAQGYGTSTLDTLYCKLTGCAITGSMVAATGNQALVTIDSATNKAAGDDTILQLYSTDTLSPGTSRAISYGWKTGGNWVEYFGVGIGTGSVKSIVYAGKLELTSSAGSLELGPQYAVSNIASYWQVGGTGLDVRNSAFSVGDGTYSAALITPGTGTLLAEGAAEFQSGAYVTGGVYATGCIGTYLKNSSAALVAGTVVQADSATDSSFQLGAANNDYSVGVLRNSCARGATCLVCTSGRVSVLVKDGQACARNKWVYQSDIAGRADFSDNPTDEAQHRKEIGHCIETKNSGTAITCAIVTHFN